VEWRLLDFEFLARLERRNLFRVSMAYLGSASFVFHIATVTGDRSIPIT